MFGMIGKITANAGEADKIIAHMSAATQNMDGCLHYIIARDAEDADIIWISEVWENEEAHKASLQLEGVRAAIGAAMPLIANFETIAKTNPVQ